MYGGVCSLGVNVRRRGVCVIVDNEVGSIFGFVVNMLCSVPLLPPPQYYQNVCSSMLQISSRVGQNSELKNWLPLNSSVECAFELN